MTLTIELPEEQEAALKAKATAWGVSAEEYARLVLDRDLARERPRHISERIREIWSDLPGDVLASMPTDGASQVDHYVYGVHKRSE